MQSSSPICLSADALIPWKIYITCDAGDEKESSAGEMNQLLQFGAACNVFYLFSLDTDQLTGPQVMIGCGFHTASKIPFMYFFSGNCGDSVPVYTFMCL